MLVLLDTGPLGLLTNVNAGDPHRECRRWASRCWQAGDRVVVPEIADYELRRELLRGKKYGGVDRLDQLCDSFDYDPLTTGTMRLAAELWAEARSIGRPTASDDALDANMILVAQARSFADDDVVVATTNAKHLVPFVDARPWEEI